jgi:hypothetical protein
MFSESSAPPVPTAHLPACRHQGRLVAVPRNITNTMRGSSAVNVCVPSSRWPRCVCGIRISRVIVFARGVAEIGRLGSVQDYRLDPDMRNFEVSPTLYDSSIKRPDMDHTVRTGLSVTEPKRESNNLPARIDVTLPSRLSRTEVAPDQSLEDLVTPIGHNRAIFRVGEASRTGRWISHTSI